MPTISELKGRPVISLNEGAKLGVIQDALIVSSSNSVGGFLLQGNDGELALPFSQIKAIGPDAITTDSAVSTQSPVGDGGLEGMRKFSDLSKQQVVDSAGKHHGHLADAAFDTATGALTNIEIRSGGFLGLNEQKSTLPISVVRSLGTSVVTVDNLPEALS